MELGGCLKMPRLPSSSSSFSISSSKFPKQTEDENEQQDDSLATHFSDSLLSRNLLSVNVLTQIATVMIWTDDSHRRNLICFDDSGRDVGFRGSQTRHRLSDSACYREFGRAAADTNGAVKRHQRRTSEIQRSRSVTTSFRLISLNISCRPPA